jgi:RIO kinase 2
MKVLHEAGFPVPTPIDHNRHAILMSVIPGCPLLNIRELGHPTDVLDKIISLAVRLAENGLVHSDYNQFNLLVSNDEQVYVIDFPQMVSIDHPHAQEFYERDMRCIIEYFYKKFKVEADGMPNLSEIEVTNKLDQVMKASGYVRSNLTEQEVEDLENIQHEEEGSSEEEIEESSVEDQDQVENQPEENQEITEDQKSSDSDSDSDEHEETAQESETGAQPDLKQKIRQQVRKQKDKQKVRRNYTKAKQKLSTKTYDSLF